MLIRLSVFLALAIAAAAHPAAADTPSTLSPDKVASIKSIGVISAIGDTLTITTNGFTVFSVSTKPHSIADMGIDDALETYLNQKLGSRFKMEKVQYDRSQFAALTETKLLFGRAVDVPPIEKLVAGLPASVDAYLVISKAGVPFGVNDSILGAGLNISRGGFHQNQYVMFAFITVSLFDARTHSLLAQVVYPPPISRFWGGEVQRMPLDGALWPDDAGNFTQVQHDQLKNVLTDDLTAIVSKTVDQLGLSSPQ